MRFVAGSTEPFWREFGGNFSAFGWRFGRGNALCAKNNEWRREPGRKNENSSMLERSFMKSPLFFEGYTYRSGLCSKNQLIYVYIRFQMRMFSRVRRASAAFAG